MHRDPPPALAAKIATLPDSPGVYLWKDADGTVLYVGKAKSLRSRVRTYLGGDPYEISKTRVMMRQASRRSSCRARSTRSCSKRI